MEILDTVITNKNLSCYVEKGAKGTVVEMWTDTVAEVEFIDKNGHTIDMCAVSINDLTVV